MTTKNHKIVCIMVFYENGLYNELLVCDGFLCILLVCDGFLWILLVCDGFLCILFLLKLFLVSKGVMCMVEKRVSFVGMLFNVIINVINF